MNKNIPLWITVVSMLLTLLGVFVGSSLYLSPATFVQQVNFSDPNVLFLAYMWGARQIAIALIIGYSTAKQSSLMLRVSLLAYCLMTFQDVFIGIVQNDSGLIIGSAIFCLLSATMMIVLWKKSDKK
ncbi:hypothetical protein [Teredinibacter purpureus]|uniref:hypothetical protein n=1 Tax=Teredinibacter purpureus TaxID=2731756 RepID=UPI0005F77955|nr:hypothetical protein [Teredinibacter purpureus]